MSERRKVPRKLVHALSTLRSRAEPPTLLAAVQRCWGEAAGAEVAGRAQPVAERNATVTIACESSVWASELTLMSEGLREALNDALDGNQQVASLRFVTGSEKASEEAV